MTDDDGLYRGFGCPDGQLDEPFLDLVVVEHARELIRWVLADDRTLPRPLQAVLNQVLDRACPFDAVWNLAFGGFLASLSAHRGSGAQRSAAALALRLHEYDFRGDWQVESDAFFHYTFDRWLLPRSSMLHVSAEPHGVSITLKSEVGGRVTHRFVRAGDAWKSDDAPMELPLVQGEGVRWPLVPAECIPTVMGEKLLRDEAFSAFDGQAGAACAELGAQCTAALRLIDEGAPSYSPWITRLVRSLVPLRITRGMQNSTTAFLAPGVIALSAQRDPVMMAETLVHEATHQYLYVLSRLGSIDDGTDTALYFSPFKNTGRPLRYIVLTYHAFGNVLLFDRMLRDGGRLHDEPRLGVDGRIEALEDKLRVLEKTLHASRTLTPIGKALWEPLFERLHP